jgi:predicted PurR-regulated permease PerM
MEFFIPGLLFFIVSIGITFMIAPNATPIMAAILSIIFLTFGVYQHYKLFAYEYRLSTWQEGLKIYSPAIMLFAIILYIIYGILAFFTGGVVPVPSIPNVSLPSVNDVTSQITNSINNVTESITNTANNVMSLNNKGNSIANSIATSLGVNNKNKKNNNLSRSFLETV